MDVDIACLPSDRLLDVINIVWCSSIVFSNSVFENSRNIFYSSDCTNNSSNLFGCIGLKINNTVSSTKQYTRQEYEILVPKIIEHMKKTWEWWEFSSLLLFHLWYNETVAMEHYPIKITDDKKQIITEDEKI